MASPLRSSTSPSRRLATSPLLRVVPVRRRAASFAVLLTVLVSLVMMGAALLHTRIAERQLEIDRLERAVADAQAEFDVLRAERAELRSPTSLAGKAGGLGMVTAAESTFVSVDPMVLAMTVARSGQIPVDVDTGVGLEPLDQFRLVKSVISESP